MLRSSFLLPQEEGTHWSIRHEIRSRAWVGRVLLVAQARNAGWMARIRGLFEGLCGLCWVLNVSGGRRSVAILFYVGENLGLKVN